MLYELASLPPKTHLEAIQCSAASQGILLDMAVCVNQWLIGCREPVGSSITTHGTSMAAKLAFKLPSMP